jgi:glycosyltransferase involved in cell wall biosynthesis
LIQLRDAARRFHAMTHSAAVSIIMVNRNGAAYLARAVSTCRTAIEQALPIEPRIEFVLVDNGSTDGPEAAIEQELKTAPFAWRIVHEPQNGVNYARNAGIENSSGDLLFFVDSDVEFDAGWLRALLGAATDRPDAQVFAGRVRVGRVEAALPAWLAINGPFVRTSIVVQCDYGDAIAELPLSESCGPIGPNMGFRRNIFRQFGGFDTRFGLRPGSLVPAAESEFFDRLWRSGISFLYVPGAVVDHPLRRAQMTRRYFRTRMHGIGRANSRLRMIRGQRPKRLCGLTLYVFPQLFGAVARWVSANLTLAPPARRFHALCDISVHLGYLHEDFRAWRDGSIEA